MAQTIDRAIYWELRTRLAEHQARIKEEEARIAALFVQAGLDPAKHYKLNDDLCTAVEAD